MNEPVKILAENRKARFHYSVEESLECGIVLAGTEVKSIRARMFSFNDSYAAISRKGELFLYSLHITPYSHGNIFNHEAVRVRKLLVHRKEISKLIRKTNEKGFTLIPLKFYLKNNRVKVELGLCRGKKLYDKRESIKKKDQARESARIFRGH